MAPACLATVESRGVVRVESPGSGVRSPGSRGLRTPDSGPVSSHPPAPRPQPECRIADVEDALARAVGVDQVVPAVGELPGIVAPAHGGEIGVLVADRLDLLPGHMAGAVGDGEAAFAGV